MVSLSQEQAAIVAHDTRKHARVLAVAGSGKTTAMVHRVVALVKTHGVAPALIRVVMYNRAAREHFERELADVGVRGVKVLTFHALGNSIVRWAEQRRLIEALSLANAPAELRRLAGQAWQRAREELSLDEVGVELDEAMSAVSYWKAQLVAPADALHQREPFYDAFYRAWEAVRLERGVRTFDDQLVEAVRLFENDEIAQQPGGPGVLTNRIEHLIVDEYQDVNPAQVRLLQHIAGERARVMVVGDDDQCIYEWRGASPAFIGPRFSSDFPSHEHCTYTLSRTFRFGPHIAACASHVIERNTERVDKTLISARPELESEVVVLADERPSERIARLIAAGTSPAELVVLVRSYHQSYRLQAALSSLEIPYLVEGERPFVDAPPVELLADYLNVLAAWHEPLNADTIDTWLRILNRPMRYVRKQAFAEALSDHARQGATTSELLARPAALLDWGIHRAATPHLKSLARVLKLAWKDALKGGAGKAARRLLRDVAFDEVFATARSRRSAEEVQVQQEAFCQLLDASDIDVGAVAAFIDSFDPTRGQPPDACVRITTVFQSKGLAWPHVIIPELSEGAFPDVRAEDFAALGSRTEADSPRDAAGQAEDRRKRAIEAERRLFYVALTRARQRVYLGLPDDKNPDRVSRFVREAQVQPLCELVGRLRKGDVAGNDMLSPEMRKRAAEIALSLSALSS